MYFFGLVTRLLMIFFGILLPARYTQRALDDEEELTSWAKYWIVHAFLVSVDLMGDTFFSWMPLYAEVKLLLVLWLVISAPQASVWIYDVILNSLLARYMPHVDNFLVHGKWRMLEDALRFTSQLYKRALHTVLPLVLQLWKKNAKVETTDSTEEPNIDINSNPLEPHSAAFSNPNNNVYYDPNADENCYDVAMPSSQSQSQSRSHSQTQISQQTQSSKHSLPELHKKVVSSSSGRPKRKQYIYDMPLDEVTLSDFKQERLLGMEDILKSQHMGSDLPSGPFQSRKETRRY